jgi:thioredoxin 1
MNSRKALYLIYGYSLSIIIYNPINMSHEQEKNLYLTDHTFEQAITKSPRIVLVDFFAPWCGPCRMMSPIIEELASEYTGKADIYKINLDENSQAPSKHMVRSIPTLIFFKEGEPIERLVGAVSKTVLQEKLDKYI